MSKISVGDEQAKLPPVPLPMIPNKIDDSSAQDRSADGENQRDEVRNAAVEAELAEIEGKFDAANMSYFDKAKLAVKYRELFRVLFPQLEEKGRGRPGIVLAMAHKLPVPGNTPKARAAWLDRAFKVANISPEAEKEAKSQGLERNQSALLKIAKADSSDEQLKIIKEIEGAKAPANKDAKKYLKTTVRFEYDRKDEILAKLIAFADENAVEVI